MTVLPYVAIALVGFAVLMYVLLDGWDLGVGILFPIAQDRERDAMMESIVPFWDGNETWLVFGGTTLFATFPAVYAAALRTLYLHVMVMLFALVFRGVSFEFRPRAQRSRIFWNWAFALGSIIAGFAQGMIVGRLVEGVAQTANGQWFSILFQLLCGVAMVGGYSMLGGAWLIHKTSGETNAFGRRVSRAGWILSLGALTLACIWVPQVANRWYAPPNVPGFTIIVVAIVAAALAFWRSIQSLSSDARPLEWAVVITILAFIGFGTTIAPYALPYQMTIAQAAADKTTLKFAVSGLLIVLPFVVAYQLFAYRVFGGKVQQRDASL
jgi:cytochrome d ubiquinol oxidase subunit II